MFPLTFRVGRVAMKHSGLPAARAIQVLDAPAVWLGYPKSLRSDNSPEFIYNKLDKWTEKNGVLLDFVQPGKWDLYHSFVNRHTGWASSEWVSSRLC